LSNSLAGMEKFLNGEVAPEEEPDPRGEDPPDPHVKNLDELRERNKSAPPPQPKKEEKKEAAAASAEIDFSKLDVRVGVITKAWEHEEADKLFCEEIDIGEDEPRQIASGLREHYSVDDLVGQRVLVLANLKTRKMMGFPSHGMVMCSSTDDKVKFVEPPADAAIGERVMVEGCEGEPATENQILKKKMLDQIFPDLKTDMSGVAGYKGKAFQTSAGPCLPSLPNADVA